jgi:AraC-like DNA-binding protein
MVNSASYEPVNTSTSAFHYLPVHDTLIEWGLYCTSIGHQTIEPGGAYPAQPHPTLYHFNWDLGRTLHEFCLVLITAGEGEFESEQQPLTRVGPNTLLMIFPGIWHRYRPRIETGWRECWVGMDGRSVHRLWELGLLDEHHPVQSVQQPQPLIDSFDDLFAHVDRYPAQNGIRLSMRVSSFLEHTMRAVEPGVSRASQPRETDATPCNDPVITQARDLIWTSSCRELTVEGLVAALPVAHRTLNRRFLEVLGHSVADEIMFCRLFRAQQMLRETDLPIKRIAYLAGFPSPERMRVTFVRQTGIAPQHYRRQTLTLP